MFNSVRKIDIKLYSDFLGNINEFVYLDDNYLNNIYNSGIFLFKKPIKYGYISYLSEYLFDVYFGFSDWIDFNELYNYEFSLEKVNYFNLFINNNNYKKIKLHSLEYLKKEFKDDYNDAYGSDSYLKKVDTLFNNDVKINFSLFKKFKSLISNQISNMILNNKNLCLEISNYIHKDGLPQRITKINKFERSVWPEPVKKFLLARDKSICSICRRNVFEVDSTYEIDHRIPLSKGGVNDYINLDLTCKKCNRSKGVDIHDDKNYEIDFMRILK